MFVDVTMASPGNKPKIEVLPSAPAEFTVRPPAGCHHDVNLREFPAPAPGRATCLASAGPPACEALTVRKFPGQPRL